LARFVPALSQGKVITGLEAGQPGERVMVLGGREVALPADGLIVDPAQLALIAASDDFQRALEGGQTTVTLAGWAKLAQPLTISVVAPAALVATAAGGGCVLDQDGQGLAVRVVSSELGQTFVSFDGPPPTAVRLDPPRDLTC
jgi:hypothetical protein